MVHVVLIFLNQMFTEKNCLILLDYLYIYILNLKNGHHITPYHLYSGLFSF